MMTTVDRPYALYVTIGIWLAALMAASIGISYLPLAAGTIMAVILTLALVKAGLVVLFFMHLRVERRLLAFIALIPFPLAIILVLVLLAEHML